MPRPAPPLPLSLTCCFDSGGNKVPYFYSTGKKGTEGGLVCPAGDPSCFLLDFTSCPPSPWIGGRPRFTYAGPEGNHDIHNRFFYFRRHRYMHDDVSAPTLERWHNLTERVGALAGYRHTPFAGDDTDGALSQHKVGEHVLVALARAWATRPLYWLREEVHVRVEAELSRLALPCAVMHVRQSDVRHHKRTIFSLAEYAKAAGTPSRPLESFASVLLMTDDHSVLERARADFPDISWAFVERQRVDSSVDKNIAYNSHLPSGDSRGEVVLLLAEMALAARCSRITYTTSALSAMIWERMCARMGWPACYGEDWGEVRRALCDSGCCREDSAGQYNASEQRCSSQVVSLPMPCLSTNICTLLGT